MLADLERATFSNIEHQSLKFIRDTIRPSLVRWEQALTRDLIPAEDRDKYFVEFLIDSLMRGDLKSRYDSYTIGHNNTWLSANDIRRLENMNPLPPEQGDVYLIPAYKHFYPGEQGKRRRKGGSQGASWGNDSGQAGHAGLGTGFS